MTLADARSLLLRDSENRAGRPITVAWRRADVVADRQALQKLALDCQRYAPLTGIEDGPAPESLFLDVAGCAHLQGGERKLLRRLARDLIQQGYDVCTALADTLGAAWGMSRAGHKTVIVPPGGSQAALAPLPITALRIPAGTVSLLEELGIETVSQLLQLPRSSLPSRFGKELVLRIDQALGHAWETFTPERFKAPITAHWDADDPLVDQRSLGILFRQLLSRVLRELTVQRAGILELTCELKTGSQTVSIPIRLVRPTAEERHLSQLFELTCERYSWLEGILSFRLEVTRAGWLAERQFTLFETDDSSERDVALLMERLSSRLGEQAVLRSVCVPEPLPERSLKLAPWLSAEKAAHERLAHGKTSRRKTALGKGSAPHSLCLSTRPWQLLPVPQRVEVVAEPEGPPRQIRWQGRTQTVTQSWGPERIETGWWRHDDVRRDYYRVELEQGHHLWLFRQCETGAWFLHGSFD